MKTKAPFLLILLSAALGCDDTPPGGAANLLSPRLPQVIGGSSGDHLFFVDQGHSMLRGVDLTTGTYQPGLNPYFPRGVMLDSPLIDYRAHGDGLVALSQTGALFDIPLDTGPAVLRADQLPPPVANWRPIAVIIEGDRLARLDEDCALAVEGGTEVISGGWAICQGRIGDRVFGYAEGGDAWIAPISLTDGIGERQSIGAQVRRLIADAGGGLWALSRDGQVVTSMDAQGQSLASFGLVAPGNDLVVTLDEEANPILAVAGQDGSVWYYGVDGSVVGTPIPRRAEDLAATALRGGLWDVVVEETGEVLAGGDYLAINRPVVFEGLVDVSAEGDIIGLPDSPLVLRTGNQLFFYADGTLVCFEELRASGRVGGRCPEGQWEVHVRTQAWELFSEVTALVVGQDLADLNHVGSLAADAILEHAGYGFSLSKEAQSTTEAIMHLRLRTGARTVLEGGGWLSGITRANARTYYNPDSAREWLFVTGSNSESVFQFPPLATQSIEVKVYR